MMSYSRALNYVSCSLLWAVMSASSYGAETRSRANAVNDFGVIAGAKFGDIYQIDSRATMWFRDLLVSDLGTLPDGTSSEALGINNLGQVVGYSTTRDGSTHAFLWERGVMRDLGTLGPDYVFSRANGINDKGEVVGVSCKQGAGIPITFRFDLSDYDPSCRAFLWRQGHMRNLGVYPGGHVSSAQAINNKGQVVGSGDVLATYDAYDYSRYELRALLWDSGTLTAIPDLSLCECGVFATGVNDRGVVIGFGSSLYDIWNLAWSWTAGTFTRLPEPVGWLGRIVYATGINNRGQIVGIFPEMGYNLAQITVPVLFQNGKSIDLPLLESRTFVESSAGAQAINQSGLIVGWDFLKAVMWEHGVVKALK